jgi:hypothetical protein
MSAFNLQPGIHLVVGAECSGTLQEGLRGSVAEYSPDSNNVSTEEPPLLRSFSRKRLVKANLEDLTFATAVYKV